MKRKAKNIFESSKYCYIALKITNLLFITVKQDEIGKYYAETTKFDLLRFICGILVGIWYIFDNSGSKLGDSQRAIIFEIALFLCSKYEYVMPFCVMTGTFYYRFEYFKIIKNLNWIDQILLKNFIHRNHSHDLYWSAMISNGNLFYATFCSVTAYTFVHITGIRYQNFPIENAFFFVVLSIPEAFLITNVLAIVAVYLRIKSIKKFISNRSSKNIDEVCRKINLSMKFRNKIYETFISLNKFFSLNSCIHYLAIVLAFVLWFLSTYDFVKNNSSIESYSVFIFTVSGYIIIASSIVSVTLAFQTLTNNLEIEICKEIECIQKDFCCEKIHKQVQLALLQVYHLPLKSSCGLITFDWKIWLTILSAAMSNIMICLQFDMSGLIN
ncbi:hypothetical protein PVAND_014219 [Polypedilum vanderplanki]|uniref:Gustatory receptor n=1 Tax=Polypedilum vanderplanki TaxID=319348 RepID=A0A9J6CSS5_POLVA|nr:hypothetical protein PVAND_014219 [Polypedilum vanderplanki]